MKRKGIYLDTAAATPLDPSDFANPSSIHAEGVRARRAVDEARRTVAGILAVSPEEIIFTSGGTEGNNLALNNRRHIVTTAIEHSSILEPARRALQLTIVPVQADGLVDPAALAAAIRSETDLVSVHYANNEIGTIQPLPKIARLIRHRREASASPYPYFHTDACQAPRFLDLNVHRLGVDLLTLNGSKIYGPKGVGCLFVKRGVPLAPLLFGGGQENGRRPGTENVPAIVGFAKALRLAAAGREKENKRLTALRDYFLEKLLALPDVSLNGSRSSRLPNNINVAVDGVEAEQLVLELDARGIACSAGSACSSSLKEESYVIMALGKTAEAAKGSIRFSLGRETKKKDINDVLRVLPQIIEKLNYARTAISAI